MNDSFNESAGSGSQAILSTAAHWAEVMAVIASVRGGGFTTGLTERARETIFRCFAGPLLGVARLAPEVLTKSKATVAIVGDTRLLTREGGRWLTLFARLLEPTCSLDIVLYAPAIERVNIPHWLKPLFLLRPPKIVRAQYPSSEHLIPDVLVCIDNEVEGEFFELFKQAAIADLAQKGIPILRATSSSVWSAISAEAARNVGGEIVRAVEVPIAYRENSQHGAYASWISLKLPSSGQLRIPEPAIVDRIEQLVTTINSLARAGGGERGELESVIGTVAEIEVQGSLTSTIRLTPSSSIDIVSGRVIEATAAGVSAFSSQRVGADALLLVPAEGPLDDLSMRFQRIAWLSHVLANAMEDAQTSPAEEAIRREAIDPPRVKEDVPLEAPRAFTKPGRLQTTFRQKTRLSRARGITQVIAASAELGRPNDDPIATFGAARAAIIAWFGEHHYQIDSASDSVSIDRPDGEVLVESEGDNVWTARFDDRRLVGEGASWRVEVTLLATPRPVLGLRVSQVRLREDAPPAEPSAPRLLVTIAKKIGLHSSGFVLRPSSWAPAGTGDISRLLSLLGNPSRTEPVVIVAGYRTSEEPHSSINRLATRLAGIAHVVVADQDVTSALIAKFGRNMAVWGKAIRVYLPGFSANSDPFSHPVWAFEDAGLPKYLANRVAEEVCAVGVQSADLDERVPPFQAMRRYIAMRRVQLAVANTERQSSSVEDERDRLRSALREQETSLRALTDELKELTERLARLTTENEGLERERNAARDGERRMRYQVQMQWSNRDSGASTDTFDPREPPFPDSWDALETWITEYGQSRLVLLPQAAKAARSSPFDDICFVYQVFHFLSEYYVPMRQRDADDESTRERYEQQRQALGVEVSGVGSALENRRYKKDYECSLNGRKMTLDMHVKRGVGFDPATIFRLYFKYDDGVVVIGWLPSHLTNRTTHTG